MIQLPCLADRCQMTPRSVAGYESSGEMDPGAMMLIRGVATFSALGGRAITWGPMIANKGAGSQSC